MASTPDALNECNKEPIHIPGTIQPFGVLIGLDADLKVTHFSSNLRNLFSELKLGCTIQDLLGESAYSIITERLSRPILSERCFRLLDKSGKTWNAHMHRSDSYLVLEMEEREAQDLTEFVTNMPEYIEDIHNTSSMLTLLEQTVRIIRLLTQCDRVMIYRFHYDHHGEVIAESNCEDVDSYLGLHYPASDIPDQARALFLLNWIRMIPDVSYTPVAVESSEAKPLDLSKSILRSVSPIHIEYLQNMGVGSSITVSLVVEQKLWGLIACHGMGPLYQCSETRSACETMGRIVSAEISLHTLKEIQSKYKSPDFRELLKEKVSLEENLAGALFRPESDILSSFAPSVTGMASFYDGSWFQVGNTPSIDQMNSLVNWLKKIQQEEPIFFTHCLHAILPEAAEYMDAGCGLMAVSIQKAENNYLLWFKPELQKSITWAGDPEKVPIKKEGRIHPRKSFQAWIETVKGFSQPWTQQELESALSVRSQILDVDFRRQFFKEQLSRKMAEEAIIKMNEKSQELEEHRVKSMYSAKMASLGEMAGGIAHEINNPLAIIISYCMRLNYQIENKSLDEKAIQESVKEINETALRISRIIDSLKFFVRESNNEKKTLVPVRKIIDDTLTISSEKMKRFNCRLEITGDLDKKILCQPVGISQIFLNLLNNSLDAIKSFPEKWIRVQVSQEGNDVVIRVTDSGKGIPKQHLPRLMEPFFTTKVEGKGTGLGLPISKGIAQQHGGSLEYDPDSPHTSFVLRIPAS